MKLYFFSSLIFQAFKSLSWGKISNLHQTPTGWAFVITDTLNGDDYVCCAYPIKSQKVVVPETVDELLKMNMGGNNE